ncbi:hypothetical protein PUN28_006369 [Cardiocondyla obscurior]|uniref:Uncharacterized protein n=1 Tax=Cardiocondyla obscurior TaxID=286306 RepID=A0AAW2G8B6_9HYME
MTTSRKRNTRPSGRSTTLDFVCIPRAWFFSSRVKKKKKEKKERIERERTGKEKKGEKRRISAVFEIYLTLPVLNAANLRIVLRSRYSSHLRPPPS